MVWLAWTLPAVQVDGRVPYPLLETGTEGRGAVAVVSVGITILVVLLLTRFAWLDRKLPPAPR